MQHKAKHKINTLKEDLVSRQGVLLLASINVSLIDPPSVMKRYVMYPLPSTGSTFANVTLTTNI